MPTPRVQEKELCQLLSSVKTEKDMHGLLRDLLTPKEMEAIAVRWQLVQMLAKGIPQRRIATELKMSISKVTRGSLALQRSRGGFRKYLKKASLRKK